MTRYIADTEEEEDEAIEYLAGELGVSEEEVLELVIRLIKEAYAKEGGR